MATLAGQAAFYYLAAASIASAVLAVTRSNPVHSMLWVLALFLHVAGIFVLVGAEFLAAVQVIVYAGAILVFYLFFSCCSICRARRRRAVSAPIGRWPRQPERPSPCSWCAGTNRDWRHPPPPATAGRCADAARGGRRNGALHRVRAALRSRVAGAPGGHRRRCRRRPKKDRRPDGARRARCWGSARSSSRLAWSASSAGATSS